MTESLYIRLAAPLQSWAGPAVTGNIVHTERFPTVTGLQGLLAGALKCRRGQWPQWLKQVEFTIRTDRPAQLTDEYQTINPRPESEVFIRRILLSEGKSVKSKKATIFTPDNQGGTSVVKRTYLADGEFLVEVRAPAHTDELESALSCPGFVTYLGRKAFAPSFPFYLGRGRSGLLKEIPTIVYGSGWSRYGHQRQGENAEKIPLMFIRHNSVTPPAGSREQVEVHVARNRKEQLESISGLLRIRRSGSCAGGMNQ